MGEGHASPSSLTFAASNWGTAQTVTITGVDDVVVDGDTAFVVVTGAVSSLDTNFHGSTVANINVTNTDGMYA